MNLLKISENFSLSHVWITVFVLSCLLIVPLVSASENADGYVESKAQFEELKEDLSLCQAEGDDCSDLEEQILATAKSYVKYTTLLMIDYLKEVKENSNEETQKSIDAVLVEFYSDVEEIDTLETKEGLQAKSQAIAERWSSVKITVKQKVLAQMLAGLDSVLEKASSIDVKLKCAVSDLSSQGKSLTDLEINYEAYHEAVASAREKYDLANSSKDTTDLEKYVKSSKKSLETAQSVLNDALSELEELDYDLGACDTTSVKVEYEDETEKEDDDSDDSSTSTSSGNQTSGNATTSFEVLLKELGLEDIYEDAENELEKANSIIDAKYDEGYDTQTAEAYLKDATVYFNSGKSYVMQEEAAKGYTAFLNSIEQSQNAADSGNFKTKRSTSGTSTDTSATADALQTCIENADYSTDQNKCYDKYDVSESEQQELEDCLYDADSSSDESECYEEAVGGSSSSSSSDDDEFENDKDDLNADIAALDKELNDLENEIEDLYDELSRAYNDLDDDDQDDLDDERDDIQADIQELEDDVESGISSNDFENEIDDLYDAVDDAKDDDDLEDIQDDIDALENEIDDFVDSFSSKINSIKDDIDETFD